MFYINNRSTALYLLRNKVHLSGNLVKTIFTQSTECVYGSLQSLQVFKRELLSVTSPVILFSHLFSGGGEKWRRRGG